VDRAQRNSALTNKRRLANRGLVVSPLCATAPFFILGLNPALRPSATTTATAPVASFSQRRASRDPVVASPCAAHIFLPFSAKRLYFSIILGQAPKPSCHCKKRMHFLVILASPAGAQRGSSGLRAAQLRTHKQTPPRGVTQLRKADALRFMVSRWANAHAMDSRCAPAGLARMTKRRDRRRSGCCRLRWERRFDVTGVIEARMYERHAPQNYPEETTLLVCRGSHSAQVFIMSVMFLPAVAS
jgi:hypothetical protein